MGEVYQHLSSEVLDKFNKNPILETVLKELEQESKQASSSPQPQSSATLQVPQNRNQGIS